MRVSREHKQSLEKVLHDFHDARDDHLELAFLTSLDYGNKHDWGYVNMVHNMYSGRVDPKDIINDAKKNMAPSYAVLDTEGYKLRARISKFVGSTAKSLFMVSIAALVLSDVTRDPEVGRTGLSCLALSAGAYFISRIQRYTLEDNATSSAIKMNNMTDDTYCNLFMYVRDPALTILKEK